MKQNYRSLLGACTALLLATAHPAMAQVRSRTVLEAGTLNARIERELIVRFDPRLLNRDIVDNDDVQSAPLAEFINPDGIDQLNNATGLDFHDLAAFKIYAHLHSTDSVFVSQSGGTVQVPKFWSELVIQLPNDTNEAEISQMLAERCPAVMAAYPNYVLTSTSGKQVNPPPYTPNDPQFGNQTSLNAQSTTAANNPGINMKQAWQFNRGDNSLTVGIMDTGIDSSHPDLNNGTTPSVVVGRRSYVFPPAGAPLDGFGHGTALAGIIGARSNNGVGISGIAGGDYGAVPPRPGVKLYDLQVADATGNSDYASVYAAMLDAITPVGATPSGLGLNILVYPYSKAITPQNTSNVEEFRAHLHLVYRAGVVFVTSKGNEGYGSTTPYFPADLDDEWALSVGASGTNGQLKTSTNRQLSGAPCYLGYDLYDSNYGGNIDLIAPGSSANVYTTQSQDAGWNAPCVSQPLQNPPYTRFNGTSAAAPHVAGVASLVMSARAYVPATGSTEMLAPEDVERILEMSATHLNNATHLVPNADTGFGRLDGGNALYLTSNLFRIVHDEVTITPNQFGPWASAVSAKSTSSYSVNFYPVLQAGAQYSVEASTATYTFNVAPLIGNTEELVDGWVRNSRSTLWGPITTANGTNSFDHYPKSQKAVNLTAKTMQVTGQRYRISPGTAIPTPNPYPIVLPDQNTTQKIYVSYLIRQNGILTPWGRSSQSDAPAPKPVLYPNPGTSSITLNYTLPNGSSKATLEFISSISGQVVQKFTFTDLAPGSQNLPINVSKLPSGLYTYRFITDTQVQTDRFVKE